MRWSRAMAQIFCQNGAPKNCSQLSCIVQQLPSKPMHLFCDFEKGYQSALHWKPEWKVRNSSPG